VTSLVHNNSDLHLLGVYYGLMIVTDMINANPGAGDIEGP